MIGDSLEVDIQGAINAGMDQIHVNFNDGSQEDIRPTFTVKALRELREIL